MNSVKLINIKILSFIYLSSALTLSAQIGINTKNPQGIFHVDARSSLATTNPDTEKPNAVQETDDLIVTTEGNVGVGTITPTTKLDINGQIAIPYKQPTYVNIKDYMLQSDATGLASWIESYPMPLYRTTINVDRTRAKPFQLLQDVPSAIISPPGSLGVSLGTSYAGVIDLQSTFVQYQPTFTFSKDALYLVIVKQRLSDTENNDLASYGDFLLAEMIDNTTYKEFIYKIPLREGTAGTAFLLKVSNAPKVYRWYVSLQNVSGMNWYVAAPVSVYALFDITYLYLRNL